MHLASIRLDKKKMSEIFLFLTTIFFKAYFAKISYIFSDRSLPSSLFFYLLHLSIIMLQRFRAKSPDLLYLNFENEITMAAR